MTDDTDDTGLFQEAVKGIRKLKQTRVSHDTPKPKPTPRPRERDEEREALADSFSDHFIPAHELESSGEIAFLRPGHSPDILKKLKNGHWDIQSQLDLHGMLAEEARLYVAEFLIQCKNRNARCIRIITGKGFGSRNGEPVLRNRLRSWLVQQEDVLAYCQAREPDGGGGALVVLLKSPR